MPVFMFTLHAYRSWMPDHPRGFIIRGHGIQKPRLKHKLKQRWAEESGVDGGGGGSGLL